MILSHSRKFIFVHLHKTAGESITAALEPHLAADDVTFSPRLGRELKNALTKRKHNLRKHSSASEVREVVGQATWDEYFTFSFVRHPVDRVRSLYYYYEKVARARTERWSPRHVLWRLPMLQAGDPLRWPGMQAYTETSGFSDFIRHPKFAEGERAARAQWDMLSDGGDALLVDTVGKFETLAQDFAEVAARLGLPQAELGWTNTSRNRSSADGMDPEDARYLEQMYAMDYDAFGYERT